MYKQTNCPDRSSIVLIHTAALYSYCWNLKIRSLRFCLKHLENIRKMMVKVPVETVHKLLGVFDTLILTNNIDLRGMYVRRDLRAIDKNTFRKSIFKILQILLWV